MYIMTDALYPMQLAVQGTKKMEWHDDWLTNVVKIKNSIHFNFLHKVKWYTIVKSYSHHVSLSHQSKAIVHVIGSNVSNDSVKVILLGQWSTKISAN